jgi:predicted dehydrogenase
MEETDFNTPSYEDVMLKRRVNEYSKPWWEKVTPYTGILYVDYVLSHQMTPLFVMFMFTILFRWGYATGRFKWFDGIVKAAGGGERGTKKKKEKKKNEEKQIKLKVGALGNLSELQYNLMEASKSIEGFEITAHANVHRQYMLDFSTAYPEVLVSYNSPRELLSNRDLNVLYIAVSPIVRFRWVRDALLSKKHVICNSPIACTGEEAAELVRVAKESKLLLNENLYHRNHPAYRRFMASVAQIGPIFRSKIVLAVPSWAIWYWPNTNPDDDKRADGGAGAFRRYGPYCLDVVRTLYQLNDPSDVSIVSAKAETSIDKNIDDKMTVVLQINKELTGEYAKYKDSALKKKRLVSIEVSYGQGFWPKANIHASGPRGTLKYYNFMLPQYYNSIEVTHRDTGFSHTDKSYSTNTAKTEALISFARSVLYEEVDTAAFQNSPIFIADLVARIYEAANIRKIKSYFGIKGWSYGDTK